MGHRRRSRDTSNTSLSAPGGSAGCHHKATRPEQEVARRWWTLPHGCALPASDGYTYTLLFAGLPGGAMGPDVRDAVFDVSYRPLVAGTGTQEPPRHRLVGDVEFHVRSADWLTHEHQRDLRYNNVVLHVVLSYNWSQPTVRQDGCVVPVCCLHDVAAQEANPLLLASACEPTAWPCHTTVAQFSRIEVLRILRRAGLLRFEQKIQAFVEQLHSALPAVTAYEHCLIVALAEGLGYGRDRVFFRAAGEYLVSTQATIPEPLGRALEPAPLDATRLHALHLLVKQYRATGIWPTLRNLLIITSEEGSGAILNGLQDIFSAVGISSARIAILICNVVLPFAAAVSLLEHETELYERAQQLYLEHPGLPGNRITRMMGKQLLLPQAPQGSCQQQGLHYIYQQTCREKICARCMVSGRGL